MLAYLHSPLLGLLAVLPPGAAAAPATLLLAGELVAAVLLARAIVCWATLGGVGDGRPMNEGDELASLRRELELSEARYEGVVEDHTEFIVRWTPAGRRTFVNPAFSRFFGVAPEEAVGGDLLGGIASEHRDQVRATLRSLSVEAPSARERHRTRLPGGAEAWTAWTHRGFFDASGALIEGQSVGHDVTDLHLAEREAEQRKDELIEAEKMIALGNLVSGVAHEISNPNQYILLNLPLLEEVWHDVQPILERHAAEHPGLRLARIPYERIGAEIPDLIQDVLRGAQRIKLIVAELRDYARQENGTTVAGIDLNDLVYSAETLLSNPLKGLGDQYRFEAGADLPGISGNPIRLEQAIINLMLNALHAVRAGGRIRVRTFQRPGAPWLELEVEDEGAGIPAEHLPRIRDPFFTTWRDDGRTGLGLAVAARIVQEHAGRLEFTSTVGRGTTARLSLPIDDEPKST